MPIVYRRTANKDYPQSGIVKGDVYYYTKLKLQRGGLVKRSKTPFKPSQLTNSSFKSSFLAVGEGWDATDPKTSEAISEAAEAIREIGCEAQESFDNMPEGLQQGDTGQTLENRANECERIADELESLADELEGLEEPEEPEEVEEPETEEVDGDEDWDAFNAYFDDLTQYESDRADYDSEIERITSEVDDLLGDMPE